MKPFRFLARALTASAAPVAALGLVACSQPRSEDTATTSAAITLPKCGSGEEVVCETCGVEDGCKKPVTTCSCVSTAPPPPPPPPPLPPATTLLHKAMRIAGPGTPTYDVAIDSILVSNSLHALVDPAGAHPDLQVDADHIYFAVTGRGADGSNPYNHSFDDGQTNYFNAMEARAQPYASAGQPFALKELAIDPSDTLYFSVLMDSRNAPALSALSQFQAQFVEFATARAYSLSIGSTQDLEGLPWDNTGDPTHVDGNNFPIWVQPDGAGDQHLAAALQMTTPYPNCDGYTGDLRFSLPGSFFTALAGQPDGASITFTEDLKGDNLVICGSSTYPNGPNGVPSALADATVTFRATVHLNPWPDMGGNVCTPGPLTPVPLGGAPDWAWVGRWSDAASNVEVEIVPDADQGLDVQIAEAQSACGSSASLPAIEASANGLADDIPIVPDWVSTLPSACVSQPPSAGVKELFQIPNAQSLALPTGNGKMGLELFTYTCAGMSRPEYKVRYTRAHQPYVLADYMLDFRPATQ